MAIASGVAAGQLLVALGALVLTRIYSVQQLGVFAVYASLLATLVPAACLRYEMAIPLPKDDREGADILTVALLSSGGFAGLIAIGVLLFANPLASLTGAPSLARYLWLLPFGVIAAGVFQAISGWAVRKAAFPAIGKAKAAQAAGQILGQVSLGVIGAGPGGLVVGDVVGRSVASSSLALVLKGNHRIPWRDVTRAGVRTEAARHKRFPFFGTWSALANAGGLHLTPVLVALVYGPSAAGWFTVGQRVMALPATIIGVAIQQVYLHQAAQALHLGRRHLRNVYIATAKRLIVVGTLLIVPAAAVAPFAFSILFGPSWRQAGVLMQFAAVMYWSQFLVSPLSQTLSILGRQDLQLIWDVLRLTLVVGTFWAAKVMGLSMTTGIGLFAGFVSLAYLLLAFITLRVVDRGGWRISSEAEIRKASTSLELQGDELE